MTVTRPGVPGLSHQDADTENALLRELAAQIVRDTQDAGGAIDYGDAEILAMNYLATVDLFRAHQEDDARRGEAQVVLGSQTQNVRQPTHLYKPSFLEQIMDHRSTVADRSHAQKPNPAGGGNEDQEAAGFQDHPAQNTGSAGAD